MWLSILGALSVILPSLIQLAEKLLGPKTGEAKKELVMGAAEIAMQATGLLATGGAAETWARIQGNVSSIIDNSVAIAFPKSPGTAQSLIDAQR